MAAYAELKTDSEQGDCIIFFSWLVRLFVMFLGVVPVAAKMLLGPPSLYGILINAELQKQHGQSPASWPRDLGPEGARKLGGTAQYAVDDLLRTRQVAIPQLLSAQPFQHGRVALGRD